MAFITLDSDKLTSNYERLDKLFDKKNIDWAIVTKLLCGSEVFLEELLKLPCQQVCDSRIRHLEAIKNIRPEIKTIYIKPPAEESIEEIVRYADISMNTQIETIKLLSEEAVKQDKTHKIIITIEMGELREGVMGDEVINFYEKVFQLENIEVVGLATNLACLYGVLPNNDKLIQLSLYKQLIEAKFNKKIPLVSGGTSVTIPLIEEQILPKGINHFRVGETLFLGTDVYHNDTYKNLHNNVFRLFAQIIEIFEKPSQPQGEMGYNVQGEKYEYEDDKGFEKRYRAIVDMGSLDVDEEHIGLKDDTTEIAGASSDMLVIDLGNNDKGYSVGDVVEFTMDYMGALRVMNSRYIEKVIHDDENHLVELINQ
jgi:predicted amino acid racemase